MRKITALLTSLLLAACSSDNSTDISENPSENPEGTNAAPVLNAQSFTINEHSPEGSVVGSIDASDADGDELTFTIESDFDLAIEEETGEVTVGPNLNLDFESAQTLSFTVLAFDGKTISDRSYELNLQDVDEITLMSDEQLELIDYFKYLTYWKGPNNTPVDFNQKWGSPMKMYLDGSITDEFTTTVEGVISQFNTLTATGDFDIALVEDLQEANAHVFFGEKSEVETLWPDMYEIIKDGNFDGYASTPSQNGNLISTRIWVSSGHEVLFKHELGHSLGFGHSDRCETEKSFLCSTIEINNDILPMEEDIIKYLYHADVPVGLSESQIEATLANLFLNE